MKLEAGKTYVIKVVDHKTCEVTHEYTKVEAIINKVYSMLITLSRVLVFAVSVCIPPLLLITVPLMKKYQPEIVKPTEYGVKA